jgi:transcriptional regulator with XRE-family HTH domain
LINFAGKDKRKMAARVVELKIPMEEVARRYNAGETMKSLGVAAGTSGANIKAHLERHGVKIRESKAQCPKLNYSAMSLAEQDRVNAVRALADIRQGNNPGDSKIQRTRLASAIEVHYLALYKLETCEKLEPVKLTLLYRYARAIGHVLCFAITTSPDPAIASKIHVQPLLPDMGNLRTKLREVREDMGITQSEAAARVGRTLNWAYRVERAKRPELLTLGQVQLLAEALGHRVILTPKPARPRATINRSAARGTPSRPPETESDMALCNEQTRKE